MFYQLGLCFLIILLLWFNRNKAKRLEYLCTLGFIAVSLFFAIRYEYGNDYWHYYGRWDSGRLVEGDNRGTGEHLFYYFMQLFDHYYKFVIAYTLIFCILLFYLVKRYVIPQYYILFFFMFMTMSTMSYNMLSAMRSTMAACVLWIAFDLFYIRKKRWVPYTVLVIVSGFFHTSALVFVILPLVDKGFSIINPQLLFGLLIVGLIVNMIVPKEIYTFIFGYSEIMKDTYGGYLEDDKTGSASIFGMLNRAIMLFPYFFICLNRNVFVRENKKEIWILAMFIIVLICYGLDIDGRFSISLYIFVIISLTMVLPKLNNTQKLLCLGPLAFYIFYNHIYLFYKMQVLYYYTDLNNYDGCFLFYKSIFDANVLP